MTSPLLWSPKLYVSEIMNMKKMIETLESKGQQEEKRLREIIEARWNLEKENKMLKEKVISLKYNIESGHQELNNVKQEIEQTREVEKDNSKSVKIDIMTQLEEFQSIVQDMVARENKLKEKMKEAKFWMEVVKEPIMGEKEIIEKKNQEANKRRKRQTRQGGKYHHQGFEGLWREGNNKHLSKVFSQRQAKLDRLYSKNKQDQEENRRRKGQACESYFKKLGGQIYYCKKQGDAQRYLYLP